MKAFFEIVDMDDNLVIHVNIDSVIYMKQFDDHSYIRAGMVEIRTRSTIQEIKDSTFYMMPDEETHEDVEPFDKARVNSILNVAANLGR